MPRVVPPGQSLNVLKRRGVSRNNRPPKSLRVNSTRAMRHRALAVAQLAELGVMSWSDADRATKVYQRITEMMLSEHELKQAGIRDEVPEDNAPAEEPELVVGTHRKHRATVKRSKDALGQPQEERTVTVELSGADEDAIGAATAEHERLDEAQLAEALRPLDDDDE